MRRTYARLTPAARRVTACEEVFFLMPDTPLRSELVAHFRAGKQAPALFETLSDRARQWLDERGLAPQGEVA